MTGAGDNSGIVALYDRWSAEEADRRDQQERLKELFAEAKDDGFNTKALRAAFRQRFDDEYLSDDQREKRAGNDADTEVYLSALARVRTRGADSDGSELGNMAVVDASLRKSLAHVFGPDVDPETGEITEPHSPAPDPSGVAADTPEGSDDSRASGATIQQEDANGEPAGEGREVRGPAGDEGNSGGGDREDQRGLHVAAEERAEPAGDSDPATGGDEASAEGHNADPQLAGAAEGLVLPVVTDIQRTMDAVLAKAKHNPETHFLNSQGLKRLYGCKQPEACAGSHRERCFTCAKEYAEEMGFSA